jgi:hypothetical protein
MKIIKSIKKRLSKYLFKARAAVSRKQGVRYHIDEFSLERITGWFCRQQDKAFLDCELSLFLNGKLIVDSEINIMRGDLLSAGFGSGRHGFNAAVNWQQFEVGENRLEFKVNDNTKHVKKLVVTEKQMLVAMSKQICAHIDLVIKAKGTGNG